MAANIYLKSQKVAMVEWPENELLISGSFRKQYVNALQKADRGDLSALVKIHEKLKAEK